MKTCYYLWVLLVAQTVWGQTAWVNRQRSFPKTITPGNYSGIAWMGGERYAVVNDKAEHNGFAVMTIRTDSLTGEIIAARLDSVVAANGRDRDEEGICYVPQWNTLLVSGEADGQVVEYDLTGRLTGRQLMMPRVFDSARRNRGLEALTYNARTALFWTTTEATLEADGPEHSLSHRVSNRLRLQCFGEDLKPGAQFWYMTDTTRVKSRRGRCLIGVSGLAALDDGRLVVLERELYMPRWKVGAFCHVKLYLVDPRGLRPGDVLKKELLAEFRTKMNLTKRSFANYEGICVGPLLADGSTLLVLVSDSQNRFRGLLRDWLRTVRVML